MTLWLSSSEPGGSCSSRGVHTLLVDLRISLLLFSWPPWGLPEPCDLSAIVREQFGKLKHGDKQIRPHEPAFWLDSVRRRSQSARRPPQSSGAWLTHLIRVPSLSEEECFPLGGAAAGDWGLMWPCLLSGHIHPLVDPIGWSAMWTGSKEIVDWKALQPGRKIESID